MQKLNELNVKFADVKDSVTLLNESGALEAPLRIAGVKGEGLLTLFVVAMSTISDEDLKNQDEKVRQFYNDLPDEAFTPIPEGAKLSDYDAKGVYIKGADTEAPENTEGATKSGDTEGAEEAANTDSAVIDEPEVNEETDEAQGVDAKDVDTEAEEIKAEEAKKALDAAMTFESDCPTFAAKGVGYIEGEKDCQACLEDFPDEAAACKLIVDSRSASQPAAQSKPKAGAKKRSRYGHMVGSMSGDIDDMVFIGMNIKDMAVALAEKHGKTEKAAQAKIRGHVGYLPAARGITVTDKEGFLSCSTEYAEGFNAENTTTSYDPKAK